MKRTRFFLLLIAAWLLTTVVHAEQSDTTIFHQCAMTHILPSVSIQSLRSVFSYWKEWNEGENSRVYMEYDWRPYTAQEPGLTLPKNFYFQGDEEQSYENALQAFRDEFNANNRQPDSIAAEKRRLVASLEAMDTLLHNKPLCFQVINAKYKGSIPRYVDALYAQSFMTSKRRFRRMVRRRSPKLLVKDLGVNYSLSMALYEAWIRQQNSSNDTHK